MKNEKTKNKEKKKKEKEILGEREATYFARDLWRVSLSPFSLSLSVFPPTNLHIVHIYFSVNILAEKTDKTCQLNK